MSSSGTPPEAGPDSQSRRSLFQPLAGQLLAWPILILASGVWFFFGARLMSRFGPDALGPAAGAMLAAAVAVTLWRWSVRDTHREAVDAGACPRCAASITRFEETPRPGALARGLEGWRCENCGLEEVGPLTSERDAS